MVVFAARFTMLAGFSQNRKLTISAGHPPGSQRPLNADLLSQILVVTNADFQERTDRGNRNGQLSYFTNGYRPIDYEMEWKAACSPVKSYLWSGGVE